MCERRDGDVCVCGGRGVLVARWRIYGVDGVVLLGEWWGAWLLICLLH